jgi:hypothetical protein
VIVGEPVDDMTVEEERRGDGRAKVPIVRHPNSDKHAAACHSALLIGRSHLMIDQIHAQAPHPFSSRPLVSPSASPTSRRAPKRICESISTWRK